MCSRKVIDLPSAIQAELTRRLEDLQARLQTQDNLLVAKDLQIESLQQTLADIDDHGCAAQRMAYIKKQSAELKMWHEYALSLDDKLEQALQENERLETLINSNAYHDGVSARAEIAELKKLIAHAADALEAYDPIDDDVVLMKALRKAAE